jgi:hypothetical protein
VSFYISVFVSRGQADVIFLMQAGLQHQVQTVMLVPPTPEQQQLLLQRGALQWLLLLKSAQLKLLIRNDNDFSDRTVVPEKHTAL